VLHSFRLKIGLLSVCLSGLIVAAFGVLSSAAMVRLGRERIDRELRALTDSQVRKPQPGGHWRRFWESLRTIYGPMAQEQYAVKVVRMGGEVEYVSPNWPEDLTDDLLPVLGPIPLEAAGEESGGGREEERPRRGGPARPFELERSRREPPRKLPATDPAFATLGGAGRTWRVIRMGNEEVTLSVAMDLADLHAEVRRFRNAILVIAPFALLAMIAAGWALAQVALRPVKRIAQTAKGVTARHLDQRIENARADEEFRDLIAVINGMLERLERSFQQATRFSADAAHELKTPLTILQAQLEQGMRAAEDGSENQRELVELLEEVQRLKTIVHKLLLLSQADAGRMPLSPVQIDLAELVNAARDDLDMLAPQATVEVEADTGVSVSADQALLGQVLDNLTSNAAKFVDEGGTIRLQLTRDKENAVFTISNTGPGIPKEDHEEVFDRFYRVDKSRSRAVDGAGLGLSLAREIARAHGGDLRLVRSDGRETIFALVLPLMPNPLCAA